MDSEGTGSALIAHWEWAAKKGLMNANTANSLKTACYRVLQSLGDDLDQIDIRTLDVDDTLTRFQNLSGKKYTPKVLSTYRSRFVRAVSMYIDYLEDPGGWKPPTRRPRKSKVSQTTKKPVAEPSRTESLPSLGPSISGKDHVDYPFPLREGFIAHLILPRDLKQAEVKRLVAFMNTLTVDFEET
ncbi:MAG: hypothetical protein AAF438_05545 [Pseudomonadota bacterium]